MHDCGCAARKAKKFGMISYEVYQHGGYILTDLASEKTLLVQLDYDFPSLARDFGWDGKNVSDEELRSVKLLGVGNSTGAEIYSAQKYLDENEGKEVEDPGYFPMNTKEIYRQQVAKKLRGDDGKFPAVAWPGGYPIIYLMEDGEVICPDCANLDDAYAEEDPSPEDPDPQWHIVGSDVYWEGPDLHCANCNKPIESAYGDPEEEKAIESIVAIYDNGGQTADRYAVFVNQKSCLLLSVDCHLPNGVNMWGDGIVGPHNGKAISFGELPENVQTCVKRRLSEG